MIFSKRNFFLWVLIVQALLFPAFSVADSSPIKGHLEDPVFLLLPQKVSLDNQRPLNLYFTIDKEACKKQYGNRYYSGCRRNLKLAGKTVRRGITMTPAIPGEWKWNDDYQLSFTPHQPWLADQEYVVDLDKSVFPEHVSLNHYTYRFRSNRFRIAIPEMKFFQDPDNPARKVVATRMTFNYPVDRATLEPRTAFSFDDRKNNQSLSAEDRFPFEITYNPDGTSARLVTPLTLLPDKEKFLKLVVDSGVQPRAQARPSKRAFSERVRVPSLDDYYRVNSATVSLVKNENFGTDQVLVLDTNVKAVPEEIGGHMEVFLLPEFHPVAVKNSADKKPYQWRAANEVTKSILQGAQSLAVSPIPVSEDFTAVHSLKLNAEPGRYLYLKLKKGLKAFGGFSMAKDYATVLRVPEFPRELRIMQAGGLLALTGEKKISVFARGLDGLRFEVGQVLPQFLSHLVTQTQGNFDSPYFKSYSFNQKDISEIATEEVSLFRQDDRTAQFTSFDFAPYLNDGKKGLFFFNIYGKRGENPQVIQERRFILVTDLGFLVKKNARGARDVFVQSVASGQAVGGAQVRVLGNNSQAVFTAETDAQGRAGIPNLNGMSRDRQPVVVVVSKGNDLSFMAYDRHDRRLNFSRFPVSGRRVQTDGLQAFLFSDRGIYRPGDHINLGMIVKPQDWAKDLEGLPLELNIIDPRGVRIVRESIRLSASGFEEYRFQTEPAFPVGRYHAHLYITNDGKRGSLLHSTSVRVEEFLPDRMKIRADFNVPPKKGWVSPEGIKVRVNLKNLYGTPATNRRVKGTLTLTPAAFSFSDFAEYRFFNTYVSGSGSVTESLPELRTDDKGEVEFDLDLKRYSPAGFFASFRAEGFEAGGGRSVAVETGRLVSSMDSVVGYNTASNLNYLKNDREHSLHWIALDPDLAPVAQTGLTLTHIRKDYISTLVKRNGQYAYESVPRERVVGTRTVDIGLDGLTHVLETTAPGDYALVLTNSSGTDVSRVEYSVAGEAHIAGRLDTRAELKRSRGLAHRSPVRLPGCPRRRAPEPDGDRRRPRSGSRLATGYASQVMRDQRGASGPSPPARERRDRTRSTRRCPSSPDGHPRPRGTRPRASDAARRRMTIGSTARVRDPRAVSTARREASRRRFSARRPRTARTRRRPRRSPACRAPLDAAVTRADRSARRGALAGVASPSCSKRTRKSRSSTTRPARTSPRSRSPRSWSTPSGPTAPCRAICSRRAGPARRRRPLRRSAPEHGRRHRGDRRPAAKHAPAARDQGARGRQHAGLDRLHPARPGPDGAAHHRAGVQGPRPAPALRHRGAEPEPRPRRRGHRARILERSRSRARRTGKASKTRPSD